MLDIPMSSPQITRMFGFLTGFLLRHYRDRENADEYGNDWYDF